MPLTSNATWPECEQFAKAVSAASGAIPKPLANIFPLTGAALIEAHSPAQAPEGAIVEAVCDGTLTETTLAILIESAAHDQQIATYRAELRNNSQPMFVTAFFTALQNGAADEILSSLRDRHDVAAQEIEKARDLLPSIDTPVEVFMHSAKPGAIDAWQKLDGHIAVIASIAAIAAQFGPRLGKWPLVTEYSLGDGFRLDDRALFCADGELVADSHPFIETRSGPPKLTVVPHRAEAAQRGQRPRSLSRLGRLRMGTHPRQAGDLVAR